MIPTLSAAQRYRILLVGSMIALFFFILWAAWAALVPFFLGLVLAYLLLPVVNFLDSHAPRFMRKWARPVAIILVYMVGIAAIAGFFSYFVPVVVSQGNVFIEVAPRYLDRLEGLLTVDLTDLLARVPPQIEAMVNANLEKAVSVVLDGIQAGLGATLKGLSQTISFVLGMLIVPFWVFYILNDETRARRAFYQVIPERAREDIRFIVRIIDELLSAYVRGQLLLCLLVGGMATIVLLVFGVDLALLLGTFAGIFELIPFLGPYLGAIPAVFIAFMERPITALWVAIAFATIQQIENIFLVPRISGNAVRFHPAVVMVIVIIGSEVAGIWGVLLAVPVSAMLRDVYQYLYLRTTERGATPRMAFDSLRASSL